MLDPAANRRGILAMLAAMACFVLNDALVKAVAASHPPGQVMALRGVFAVAFALILSVVFNGARLRGGASPLVLARGLLEALVAALFITALSRLPLANITAILQTTPILLTVASVVLGIERVGWRRWGAVGVGFLGVLLIVRPSATGFNAFALVALSSAVLAVARDLVTRRISSVVPAATVTLTSNVMVALLGASLAPIESWPTPGWDAVGLLAGAAALVTLGSLSLVVAYRNAEISVVAPFRYSIVVLAIVLGFVLFGEWPDPLACLGIGLVVASGVYTISGEQARRREAQRASLRAAPESSAG